MGFCSRLFILSFMVIFYGFHPFIGDSNPSETGRLSNKRVFQKHSPSRAHRTRLRLQGRRPQQLRRLFYSSSNQHRVVRKIQTYEGIKVFGSRVVEVFKGDCSDCKLASMGRKAMLYSMSTLPWVPLEIALKIAREKKKRKFSEGRLIIYPTEDENHLAWLIEEDSGEWGRLRVFLDARDGHIINSYENIAYAAEYRVESIEERIFSPIPHEINVKGFGVLDNEQNFHVIFNGDTFEMKSLRPAVSTFQYKWRTRMPGQKITSASENFHSVKPSAIDAQSYSQKFLSFLYERFDRYGFDNEGGELIATVDYSKVVGSSFPNAFWNGRQVVFGRGTPGSVLPLAGAFDVVVHEISHAIIEKTSGLEYQGESGALNEAFADIMATYAEHRLTPEKEDWKIGEDVWTPDKEGDALRYMNNPTQDGRSRDHYNNRFNTKKSFDNGGVHINSGIVNLAFYLLVEGGAHPRLAGSKIEGIGWEKAIDIFYKVFTLYLAPSSKFRDARDATVFIARELYSEKISPFCNASLGFGGSRKSGISQS